MNNVISIYNEKSKSGKTFVSVNLAEAIAKNNLKVLLFDLSLDSESILRKIIGENIKPFIEKNGKIVSGTLTKKIHVVFLDQLPKATVIETFKKFLENNISFLKEKYDYVIFDSNSIFTAINEVTLLVSDSLVFLIDIRNFMTAEINKPLNIIRKIQNSNNKLKLDFVILNNFVKNDTKSTSCLLNIMQILSNHTEIITLNYNKSYNLRIINDEPWTQLGVQFNEMTKKIINKINLLK